MNKMSCSKDCCENSEKCPMEGVNATMSDDIGVCVSCFKSDYVYTDIHAQDAFFIIPMCIECIGLRIPDEIVKKLIMRYIRDTYGVDFYLMPKKGEILPVYECYDCGKSFRRFSKRNENKCPYCNSINFRMTKQGKEQ